MVTVELREFSKDAHLYVKNDRAVVKDLKGATRKTDGQGHISSESPEPMCMIQESKVLEGNIGYLRVPVINIKKNNVDDLYDAMKKVQGTKALATPTFQFTSRDGNFTIDSTVSWLKEKKYENPVFILVNKKTASAAEAFAFVLQQKKRAKIVGENSAGATYINSWYAIDDENFVSVSTAIPSVPGTNNSWELTGVLPDIKVKKGDALETALREAVKA